MGPFILPGKWHSHFPNRDFDSDFPLAERVPPGDCPRDVAVISNWFWRRVVTVIGHGTKDNGTRWPRCQRLRGRSCCWLHSRWKAAGKADPAINNNPGESCRVVKRGKIRVNFSSAAGRTHLPWGDNRAANQARVVSEASFKGEKFLIIDFIFCPRSTTICFTFICESKHCSWRSIM